MTNEDAEQIIQHLRENGANLTNMERLIKRGWLALVNYNNTYKLQVTLAGIDALEAYLEHEEKAQ